jgi:integrase
MQQYYIDAKKLKNGFSFTVRFVDPTTGEIAKRSINRLARKMGVIGLDEKITKKRDAEKVCVIAIEKGEVFKNESGMLFCEYVNDYWDFEGDRIRLKNLRKKNTINEDYAVTMQGYFKNHVKSLLPKDLLLKDVTESHINKAINKLLKKGNLANSTISKIQLSMTTPLKEAYKRGVIDTDPTKNLEPIDTSEKKERGILTPFEMQSVIGKLYESDNRHAFLATALSAYTGMREGEIRALRGDSIELLNEHDVLLKVESSFAKKAGFKSTKGKKVRYVPVPRKMADSLLEFASKNTWGNGLIFWSFSTGKSPISATYVQKGFNKAVADVLEVENDCVGETVDDPVAKAKGIVDKQGKCPQIPKGELLRLERNIVFHSLRHFYVSSLRGKVNDATLRLTSGHESEGMSDNYTHVKFDTVREVALISENLIQLPS